MGVGHLGLGVLRVCFGLCWVLWALGLLLFGHFGFILGSLGLLG